ncbi:RDD family protein [Brevirhabdus sp.]|uniref:RDD family protein n=1 Tax=Brevirhabdus sp. TaxID=2004514 RepID=UPI00405A03CD
MNDTYYAALPDPERHAEFYRDVPSKRLFVWIVDVIITGTITALLVPFTLFTALFYLPLLYLTVGFLYRWATLSGRSATWGMRLAGIEFRTRMAERFDAGTALLHTIGYSVSMAMVIPQVLSVGLMMTGPRRQGLSDLILGSAAINKAQASDLV